MKRLASIAICLLLACAASVGAADLGKNFEASMVVTGTITVNPDGGVQDYALHEQDKLPPGVIKVIEQTASNWRFEPVLVDGKPVAAKTQMSMRVVARPIDDQHATLRVSGALFGTDTSQARSLPECANGACLTIVKRLAPKYPVAALRESVSGIVYVVQEIGRDGRVERQAIRQVNLRNRGNAAELRRYAKTLGYASLAVARDWTYQVPTTGEQAKRDHWIVTVPVNYTINGVYGYGQWDPYIPGPVQDVSWANGAKRVAALGDTDAIPANGGPFIADDRFVLLTPVGHDAVAPEDAPGQG